MSNHPKWALRRLKALLDRERNYNKDGAWPFSCHVPTRIGRAKYRLATRRRDDGEFEAMWFRWAPDSHGRQTTVVVVPWICIPSVVMPTKVSRDYWTSDGCWWHDGEHIKETYVFQDVARPDYEICRKLLDLHLRTQDKEQRYRGVLWILNA